MTLKVLYVVPPSIHFAGVERVVHDVASGLATRYADRIDITVLYCHRYAELSDALPYRVIWESVRQLRTFPFRVGRWLRRDRYDVVVGAQFEPTALVWLTDRLTGGDARFVMHLHGNPEVERAGSRRARFAFLFFNSVIARMEKVVAVSPSLALHINERVRGGSLVEYLPNPVRQFVEAQRAKDRSGPVQFVSIGRLAPQKGFDILVEAFARIVAEGVDARLKIVGEGAERDILAAQIRRLGVEDRVTLAGKVAYPIRELEEADCFISASRWEGFGVAIVEALSAGLYVIASDCEFGPSDLIDSSDKGQIVPADNVGALASSMSQFARTGRSDGHDLARRNAAALFSLENIIFQHAEMLEAVSGRAA